MKESKTFRYIMLALLTISGVVFVALSDIQSSAFVESSNTNPPNILVILADDAGYADFGFMGSEDILTPNLDRLAEDGVIFTDAHVSASVCSPSRAGLLTGKYQQRFGHECNLEPDQTQAFDGSQVTIAEFMQKQGYQTSIFGKWHLGEEAHQHPLANGFDYFWGFLAGGRSYFPDKKQDALGDPHAILENHQPTSFDGYLTDAIGDQAVNYIKNRKEKQPFFMYLAFNAPHTPMHAKQDVVASFGPDHKRPVYAAMLWSMDEAIGNVIGELKKQGIYENTLIFFLSDNGGAHNNQSSVYPLKGWKGNQFEGGTRVPFTVTWKGQVPSGKQFDGLSSSLDVYSSVKGLFQNPQGETPDLDGVNLIPYLKGQKQGAPHQQLFWRKGEMATIRKESYKYITLKDSISVLYDLSTDITETNNLLAKETEKANALKSDLKAWEDQLSKPIWLEPEQWNTVTERIYEDLMNNIPPMVKDPGDLKELGSVKSH